MKPLLDPDKIPVDELVFYKRQEAAQFLQTLGLPVSKVMLSNYAHQGIGPYFVRVGKWSIYPQHELIAWAKQQMIVQPSQRKVLAA
jgi:hypothetical protein